MGGSKIGEKPEKKILNPQEKLAAINRVNERGESKASVARDLGIPESTLRGWCKNSLRINYQSSRSSPDTDDALKLSPTNNLSNKRKSLISSSNASSKRRGRRPNSPNSSANQLLMTTSTLTELNRLKAEYGLTRPTDYLTQSSSIDTNTNSLDAAMRGWALQMQMLLQASMAISSSDINTNNQPITNPLTTNNSQPNISSSSLLTTTTNTTSNMINQLWAPLIDSSSINNPLYSSTMSTPSTSSTLPLNLNFPTSSTTNLSQLSSASLLMNYLPNSLLNTANLNQSQNPTVSIPSKSPKYNTSLSPHYQTPKCPWRTSSPTGFAGSSTSSSASMSPKSRTSLNSHGFNDVYYGTDEENPVLTNLSPSNEETSSESLLVLPQPTQAPVDFSNHLLNQNIADPNEMLNSNLRQNEVSQSETQCEMIKREEVESEESSENSNKTPIELQKLVESPKAINLDDGSSEKNDDVQKKNEDSSAPSISKAESCNDGQKKSLESVLATVFQVTNNNTIVSLNEEQKSISMSEAITCGEVFLKFLETAEDPNVTASQITQFRHILGSIKSGCAQKSSERKPKVSRK